MSYRMLSLIVSLLTLSSPFHVEQLRGPRVDLLVVDARNDTSVDLVKPSCAILRIRCVVERGTLTDTPDVGQVGVLLTDVGPLQFGDGWALGVTVGSGTCMPVLWADADPIVLAHELGHALGLPHVAGEESLMYPIAMGGRELSRDERKAVREGARELRRCGG